MSVLNSDQLPAQTGLKLGNQSQQWDAYLRNATITGTLTTTTSTQTLTGSLIIGGTATKQSAGGPEQISLQYTANPQVWLAMFKGTDGNAKMLVDDNSGAGFEFGPGGSGAFSDQDTSLKRYDSDGIVRLVTNTGVEFDRSDSPGGIRTSINVGPYSSATLTSNGSQPANGTSVTVGGQAYTFKNTLASAYDVKIGSTARATLVNLKLAINAAGTAGTNYGVGTAANSNVVVAASYINDNDPNTSLLNFRCDGKAVGATVNCSSTTGTLTWSASSFIAVPCFVRVNGDAQAGYGALDVYSIGSTIPVLRLGAVGAGNTLISGYVNGDAQPRFGIDSNGATSWGGGSGATDITLFRFGANQLALGTGGQFLPQTDAQSLGAATTNRWTAYLVNSTLDGTTNSGGLLATINNFNITARNNALASVNINSRLSNASLGIDSSEDVYAALGSGKNFKVGTAGTPYPFIINNSGTVTEYNGIATSGNGITSIYAAANQSNQSGVSAGATLVNWTPPAAIGTYRLSITIAVSAVNTPTLGWTATWTDSGGNAQAPTNLSLTKMGVAAPALTFTPAAHDVFYGSAIIDTDNSGTAVTIKTTFSGTSISYKASATIERLQ